MTKTTHHYDVLILGSGAAGLSLALKLFPQYRIAVLSKSMLKGGSSLYAQGGIAAVLDDHNDSIAQHIQDTLLTGAGLCHEDAVRLCATQGSTQIQWLIEQGVQFSPHDKHPGYHLTREGGHSRRRVIHAADATGKALIDGLLARAREQDNIDFFENYLAIDLILADKERRPRCIGLYALDKTTHQVEHFLARKVVIATGGASKVYLYTSNPDTSTGDGIAMAWRAGCRIANMEFNQFHPTCLYHSQAKSFLISEALRGEGAKLRLPDGSMFMHKFDRREELAPRDIVARAIDYEMKRTGSEFVYLDISHHSKEFILLHFPTIYHRCLQYHIDISKEPIPVVPAAHYTCGGIMTNLQARTDIDGLYAIGEAAFTGLHGANRMASNSLLECIVFADAAARDINAGISATSTDFPHVPPWDESRVTGSQEGVIVSHNWDELRRVMWDYVGIVRTKKRLQQAAQRLALLQQEVLDYYRQYRINNDLIELRNLVQVAELIIRSAISRQESRGLHYILDYPHTVKEYDNKDTVLRLAP